MELVLWEWEATDQVNLLVDLLSKLQSINLGNGVNCNYLVIFNNLYIYSFLPFSEDYCSSRTRLMDTITEATCRQPPLPSPPSITLTFLTNNQLYD